MSIQSDVEILSVQAVEYYAQKHHLSEGDVFDLFCKHQVFEKILIQHEMLHQLDMEETFQYVEEIIKENALELVLYHGSNIAFDEIDLGKSHNRRDFGRGFYCTALGKPGGGMGQTSLSALPQRRQICLPYLFHQTEDLKIKHFAALDREWLEFIKENRTKGGIQHAYDVVVGPVADDNTMETVQLYLSGVLKAEEAVERLRYNKVNNQVSFHTPLALEHLTLESRREVS